MKLKTKLFLAKLYCKVFHRSFFELLMTTINREGKTYALRCKKCLREWTER